MNEQHLAIGFLVIVYILAAPLIPIIADPAPGKFTQDYKRAFWGFHAIVLCVIGIAGVVYGLWWAIGVLVGAA